MREPVTQLLYFLCSGGKRYRICYSSFPNINILSFLSQLTSPPVPCCSSLNCMLEITHGTCCALTLPLALMSAEKTYNDSRHDERDLSYHLIFRFAAGHFIEKKLLLPDSSTKNLRCKLTFNRSNVFGFFFLNSHLHKRPKDT